MKVFKISLIILTLAFLGNTNSFATSTITNTSKVEVHEQTKTGHFLVKAKTYVVKAMSKTNKNLKYMIILWLSGGLLVIVGGVLSVFLIGIPILILGVITMFAGTIFFYKWIIGMIKE